MMGGVRIAAGLQALALCLAVMLIGVRGLVPADYMIDISPETGTLVLRLCGGLAEHGSHHKPDSPATGHAAHDDHAGHTMPAGPDVPEDHDLGAMCPFALSAVFDLPAVLGETGLSLFGPPLLGSEPHFEPVRVYDIRPALPPRGPPLPV